MTTPSDVAALVEAAWQILDDMGARSTSTSGVAKAMLRVAFEPFHDPKEHDVMDMPFAEAKQILKDADVGFPRRQAPDDFHEVWWIYSPRDEVWAGMRIAHFRKTVNGALIFIIPGDTPQRTGIRIWDDVSEREGWTKIQQIPIPAIP